jgi:cell division protein FtsB
MNSDKYEKENTNENSTAEPHFFNYDHLMSIVKKYQNFFLMSHFGTHIQDYTYTYVLYDYFHRRIILESIGRKDLADQIKPIDNAKTKIKNDLNFAILPFIAQSINCIDKNIKDTDKKIKNMYKEIEDTNKNVKNLDKNLKDINKNLKDIEENLKDTETEENRLILYYINNLLKLITHVYSIPYKLCQHDDERQYKLDILLKKNQLDANVENKKEEEFNLYPSDESKRLFKNIEKLNREIDHKLPIELSKYLYIGNLLKFKEGVLNETFSDLFRENWNE